MCGAARWRSFPPSQLDLFGFTLDKAAARILFPPLTQLHTLRLNYCTLGHLSVLSLASSLTALSLSSAHAPDALAELQQCAKLTRLQLVINSGEVDPLGRRLHVVRWPLARDCSISPSTAIG